MQGLGSNSQSASHCCIVGRRVAGAACRAVHCRGRPCSQVLLLLVCIRALLLAAQAKWLGLELAGLVALRRHRLLAAVGVAGRWGFGRCIGVVGWDLGRLGVGLRGRGIGGIGAWGLEDRC